MKPGKTHTSECCCFCSVRQTYWILIRRTGTAVVELKIVLLFVWKEAQKFCCRDWPVSARTAVEKRDFVTRESVLLNQQAEI